TASNLSRLDAFPVLMTNIVRWSAAWLPATASPGERLTIEVPPATATVELSHTTSLNSSATIQQLAPHAGYASAAIASPGLYSVVERGAWGERDIRIAANAAMGAPVASSGPLVISRSGAPPAALGSVTRHTIWWPLLGLIAALAIALEWLFATL